MHVCLFSKVRLTASCLLNLTWPKLRNRWEAARTTPGGPYTVHERNAIWEHAARTAAKASAQIRFLVATSPASAADAAWATADTLHAAAATLGSRVLRRRLLRPRRPSCLWPDAPADIDREQPAPDCPAAGQGRRCQRRPHAGPGDADHPARRTR